MKKLLLIPMLLMMTGCASAQVRQMSLYTPDGIHLTIYNTNGTMAKDLTLQTIDANAAKYNSLYWIQVQSMAHQTLTQWAVNHQKGNQ